MCVATVTHNQVADPCIRKSGGKPICFLPFALISSLLRYVKVCRQFADLLPDRRGPEREYRPMIFSAGADVFSIENRRKCRGGTFPRKAKLPNDASTSPSKTICSKNSLEMLSYPWGKVKAPSAREKRSLRKRIDARV